MWTALRNLDDWENYKRAQEQAMVKSPIEITWGSGPTEYPCMVASIFPANTNGMRAGRAFSAFFYTKNADDLLALRPSDNTVKAPVAEPTTHTQGSTQAQYNRWVAAQMLAVVRLMVETGICTKEKFENSVVEALELVTEHMLGKNKDNGDLTAGQLATLGTLKVPKV